MPCNDMYRLRKELNEEGYKVNIETNGTMSTALQFDNEFFTVDYKCGCSGETSKMNLEAFVLLGEQDVVKFVVSKDDFEQVRAVIEEGEILEGKPFVYLSPCFGKCDLRKLAQFVKELYQIYPKVGLSLQTHKIIWSPEERGV